MPPTVQEQQANRQQQGQRVPADPYSDPVAYLRANGFKPLGNPEWPNCLWIDESKPLFAKEERVEKKAPFLRPDPRDPKKAVVEMRQIKQRSANAAGHVEEIPVFQIRHTPAQTPVFMQEALMHVMEREHQKQVAAERAKTTSVV